MVRIKNLRVFALVIAAMGIVLAGAACGSAAPASSSQAVAATEVVTPTATPTPSPTPSLNPAIQIVAVDKGAEVVDIVNQGEQAQNLQGWTLLSEKGNQACPLSGTIAPGETLRVWALSADAGQGGFNCAFDANIWNNGESDPAVLYDSVGREVSRF
jgi:hypothetical protein